ncbi:MAG: FAD-binding protein [Dehalococcoidales bacterium]|nr:MAG: FAD-binding protein [Dehalococcoidales bacterium]
MAKETVIETDILVLGGGIAGCTAAITSKEQGLDVTLVDKAYVGKSGTSAAAGMRFSVFNPELGDNYEETYRMLTEGGTCDRDWTEICIKESFDAYKTLASWGVPFPVENEEEGVWVPKGIDSAFSATRIIRRGVTPPLREKVLEVGVRLMDRITVTDLLMNNGRVVGAVGFPVDEMEILIFKSKATILCTGSWSLRTVGAETHNMTGDGHAMAYRVGAELTGGDMHGSHHGNAAYPSWRGGRAARAIYRRFIDAEGNVIPYGYELGFEVDLAFHHGRGPIFHDLDAATDEEIERVWQRQQNSDGMESARINYDPRKRGKHKITGGQDCVVGAGLWPVGLYGSTTVTGLFAAGDTLSIRAPGFGGLPSGTIMGKRASKGAADYIADLKDYTVDDAEISRAKAIMMDPLDRKSGFDPRWITQLLLNTMTPYYVLMVQHGDRLQAALTMVEFFRDHFAPQLYATDPHELRLAHEVKNMILGSELALRSCLFREETRGGHYREDFPETDNPGWLAWTKIKQENGEMKLWKQPVPNEWLPEKYRK